MMLPSIASLSYVNTNSSGPNFFLRANKIKNVARYEGLSWSYRAGTAESLTDIMTMYL